MDKILTDEQIREIADNMEMGLVCFIHKQSYEVVCIPDELRFPAADMEYWEEDARKVEENDMDYYEIEPLAPSDSFRVMEQFVETLGISVLKDILNEALHRPKPFRNFKNIIQAAGDYGKQWAAFQSQWHINWVKAEIRKMEEMIEEEKGEE